MFDAQAGDRVYDAGHRRFGFVVLHRLLMDTIVLQDSSGHQWEAPACDVVAVFRRIL